MRTLLHSLAVASVVLATGVANANDIPSSTMYFHGTLTDNGDGTFTGVVPMIDEGEGASGYDIYAEEGATAWFGNDPGTGPVWTSQAIGADHDAWPTWTPDTPDWYQYSLSFYVDGSTQKWAVRNHAGATADDPWYEDNGDGTDIARGVPMSGLMNWTTMYAAETDTGAYLPGTGTPEIPGGAAGYGGGAGAWDMDWSWGSEAVPLELGGFTVSITEVGGGVYDVTLTPGTLNTVESSTMVFEGALTDAGGGVLTGTIPMTVGAYYVLGGEGEGTSASGGFDVYAQAGGTAYVQGMTPDSWTIGSDHDAYSESGPWGTWYDPDCADWNQYSLELTTDHWYLRYTPTGESPMSGEMHWAQMWAPETDLGTQDGGHDGSAAHGGGAGAWDWDCGWGVEVIPLELPGFAVEITDLGEGDYRVTMMPAPTEVWVDDDFDYSTPGWGVTHFDKIQDGIDAVAGSTVNVAAGTYYERLTIDQSMELRGAQYGVDPTAPGARTNPSAESIITESGLSTPNPDVLIEIPSGVTGVVIDGFTLEGDLTTVTADTSTIRCWDDNITISNNIIDGRFAVLYKGADALTVSQNHITANKAGVTIQPNPATNTTITDNTIAIGSSPAGDESGIYLTETTGVVLSGNTVTGFPGRGIGGSNHTDLEISGNIVTGNRDGVSIWGTTTFVDILDNDLSGNTRYGINIKGQDIAIEENDLSGNGDVGVNVAKHVLDTERVSLWHNDLGGNTNFGLQVDVAVTETVDAEENYWGPIAPAGVAAEVTGLADFDPWCNADFTVCTFTSLVTDTYVDDDYAGLTDGTEVDWPYTGAPGGGHYIGYDAFATVQGGIDGATGSTVNVAAGTYTENITVDKSVEIIGAGSATTFIQPGTSPVVNVTANDVSISDLAITDAVEVGEGIQVNSTANLTLTRVHFPNLGAGVGPNSYGVRLLANFTGLTVTDCEFVASAVSHGLYTRIIGIFAPNDLALGNFSVSDTKFEYTWVGIYLRSGIDGLDVTGCAFGPVEAPDFRACVAGIYIGDGTDDAFDLLNVSVTGNTFTDYGRGVYVWNYAANATVDNFVISGNTFTNSVWSSGIRFIFGLDGFEDYSVAGIDINNNTFTQDSDLGAYVGLVDLRTYDATLVTCNVAVTDNNITFTGGPYADAMYGVGFLVGGDGFYNTTVARNDIDGGNTGGAGSIAASGVTLSHYADDYTWTHALDLDIINNAITGFDNGVSVFDSVDASYGGLPAGSDVTIHENSIAGDIYAVRNDDGVAVNASGNYYAETDPALVAAMMSANVDYTPWLGDGTDTNPGFDGDFSTLWVDDDSLQVGSLGYIEEALGLVTASTIHVAAGTYNEAVTIGIPVELLGEDGAVLDGTGLGLIAGVNIHSGEVTFDNIDVMNFGGNGMIVGYEPGGPGDLQNVAITNCTVAHIRPGSSHGFGIYVGYESEGFTYTPPDLTDFLDYSGLVISGNEVYDTTQAALVIQSLEGVSGPLEVSNNYFHNSDASGVWLDSCKNVALTNNLIEDNSYGIFVSAGSDGWYEGDPNQPFDTQTVVATENTVQGNANFGVGVYDGHPASFHFNGNTIQNNGSWGMVKWSGLSGTDIIDAQDNFWGSGEGPEDTTGTTEINLATCGSVAVGDMLNTAPVGMLGNAVSDGVDYCPWHIPAQLTLNVVDDCVEAGVGGTVIVYIDLTDVDTVNDIVGGDFFLSYDNTVLDFVSADPAATIFTEPIYEDVDEDAGTIDYATGIDYLGGGGGTTEDANMAVITFIALDEICDTADLVTFRSHTPPTKLSDEFANPVYPALTNLAEMTIDGTPPVLSGCPATPITVECDAVPAPAAVTANDNCDGPVAVTYEEVRTDGVCDDTYTLTRTWTAEDDCENSVACTQVITVQDTTPPEISNVPADETVECDAIPTPPGTLPASDNCDPTVTQATYDGQTITPGSCDQAYTITRTWTAVDRCSNSTTETQVITVQDTTAPVFDQTCPLPAITVYADAGTCEAAGTTVSPTTATATDNCDPAPSVTFVRSDGKSNLMDPYEAADSPITITWTAEDDCGNADTCSQTVTVEAYNELVVDLAFYGAGFPTTLTRCVTFELWECPDTVPTEIVELELTFDSGAFSGTVEVPCGNYTCITARDTLHTLRRTITPTTSGTQYVADFITAGKDLVGGNFNDDFWIDILDFGVFTWQWGEDYGSGDTDCSTPYPHADATGDGLVGTGDFTFIQTNYLEGHDDNCCGQPGLLRGGDDGPTTEISVDDLEAMGLGHLAIGDLNNDGWLDEADIVAFMQGVRPKSGLQPVDDVLRSSLEPEAPAEAELRP